jgi:cyclase
MVLSIDATALGKEPDYVMIRNLAAECRMPLCYGGGIKNVEQADRIISMGVEKVAISSAAVEDPALVANLARRVGSQSVVVVMDVRGGARGEVFTHNGTRATKRQPVEFARQMQELGAGELVVNSIDNDGVMKGYDFDLMNDVRAAVSVPLTALGGAGSLADMRKLVDSHGLVGAAAGSLFVFKGVYRAVLISYPSRVEKDALVSR